MVCMPSFALAVVTFFAAGCRGVHIDSVAMQEVPWLMSHNAATGYLETGTDVLSLYGKNQVGTFASQLDCGARSLDLRPRLRTTGDLEFYHGYLAIEQSFGESMDEMKEWALRTENNEEIVLLQFKGCAGESLPSSGIDSDCVNASIAALREAGFAEDQIVRDCGSLALMTVAEAKALGRSHHSSGATGALLALVGLNNNFGACMKSNWARDAEYNVCHEESESCTTNANDSAPQQLSTSIDQYFNTPAQRLYDHLVKITSQEMPEPGAVQFMNSASAFFQVSGQSAILGFEAGGSLILDEAAFKTNLRMACWIRQSLMANLTLVQVDSVCSGGTHLLREMYLHAGIDEFGALVPDSSTLDCSQGPVVTETGASSTTVTSVSPSSTHAVSGLASSSWQKLAEVFLTMVIALHTTG